MRTVIVFPACVIASAHSLPPMITSQALSFAPISLRSLTHPCHNHPHGRQSLPARSTPASDSFAFRWDMPSVMPLITRLIRSICACILLRSRPFAYLSAFASAKCGATLTIICHAVLICRQSHPQVSHSSLLGFHLFHHVRSQTHNRAISHVRKKTAQYASLIFNQFLPPDCEAGQIYMKTLACPRSHALRYARHQTCHQRPVHV